VTRANTYFNISLQVLFSKCHQTFKENRYAFATGYRKLYLPSVACR